MRSLFALTVILAATFAGFGQPARTQAAQCTLTLAESPNVRGLKLGMGLESVLALFPGARDDEYVQNAISRSKYFPHFGVMSFGLDSRQFGTKEAFTGITLINFVFLDEKLVEYYVQYERPNWPKLDDFVEKVAGAFQLPAADMWTTENAYRKNLVCEGFRVQATTRDGNGALTLRTNAEPLAIQRERRAAAEAQARRDFKP